MIKKFEANIVACFFLSLAINGLCLAILFQFDLRIDYVKFVIPLLTFSLVFLCILSGAWKNIKLKAILTLWGLVRIGTYGFVFLILCYNGGLIELIADSWYHLSLANKISEFSTFSVDGHLNGVTEKNYPRLWHGNLALLHNLSGSSFPMLWNSVTAWIGVFKVMAFYLFTFGLSKSEKVAAISIVLFVLLPGMGDSYLRVSAWPSHISYTAWFVLFFLTFQLFDRLSNSYGTEKKEIFQGSFVCKLVRQHKVHLITFVFVFCIVGLSHLAEIVWYTCGLLFYAIALIFCDTFMKGKIEFQEPAFQFLRIYMICIFLAILLITVMNYSPLVLEGKTNMGVYLLIALVVSITAALLGSVYTPWKKAELFGVKVPKILLFIFVVMVLMSVDVRQVISLFIPHIGYKKSVINEAPLILSGLLEGWGKLPSWHMQLRPGLLYVGVTAIALSIPLAFFKPGRSSCFLLGNSVIPFIILVSPYFYTWFSDMLQYHSAWRVSLLIFHPIILAYYISMSWDLIIGKKVHDVEV
ncbi:hypothetical protein [Desulfopila inferna]|uniref:hypothetical protein n=1 Tax=Desulfopila inferna TaxID=468528 RepID=UPI001962EFF4|nr:hypothetical protein [Desulfopila inferna]MBM9602694.1 hypothetical protein [Desulfopila inferna]